MNRGKRTFVWAASLAAAMALASGCGSGSGPSVASGASTPPPARLSLAPADVRTCVSIQALLGHLAVETSKWVPDKDPFSPAVAAQIHTTAASLARSVPQAQTSLVRLAVNANAQAFGGVAHAMKAKDRKAFDKALVNTKAAFRGLKQVCNLDK